MTFRHATSRRALRLACLISLLSSACGPAGDGPGASRQRVQASGAAADTLVAAGARVVEDYGGFRVLEATPAQLQALPAGADVVARSGDRTVFLNAGPLDTTHPAQLPRTVAVTSGTGLHLVQFTGPVRPEWWARLRATGVRVVSYVPSNAYLVYGDATALNRLHSRALTAAEVQWDGPYLPAHKVDARVAAAQGSYAVQLVEDAAPNAQTLSLARSLQRREGRVGRALGYVNLVLHAGPEAVEALAQRPDVVSIQPYFEPHLMDERQDIIVSGQLEGAAPAGPGYLAWLAAKGFTQAQFDASAFGVDITDSGIDNGTQSPNHFGLYVAGDVTGTSRVVYNRLEGTPSAGSTISGCDGHGTLNSHIVAGYSSSSVAPFADAQGFRYGLGVAPFVRLGSSVIFDPDSFTFPDYAALQSRAYAAGMRVSSNSWGADDSAYTMDSQQYDALVRDAAPAGSPAAQDGNQEMVIVFAAGNAGPGGATVGTPGSAKNVLTVGASENVRPLTGSDGCGIDDTGADSALDIIFFSSRGPTADGRTKPDLMAPGTHVSGGVAQAAGQHAQPPGVATGQALECYFGGGVCGGVGSTFMPAGQQWYTASSGTSHSTPAVAGAAALVRQYFLNRSLRPPSPAMTKAFLMNTARYMTGLGAGDNLYSNNQGTGLLDLGAAFDDTSRLLEDEEAADLFTATGQTRVFTGFADGAKPFRVTLAWTDAPGPTFGVASVNDLDLTVTIGGATYLGNVFQGATSVVGGTRDALNNVESVFLPAGVSGPFTVTVTAANIAGDGVPGNGTALDQDFALVISNNCADAPPPVPTGVTATAAAANQITVNWTPNGAAQYAIYRATGTGPLQFAASVAAPPFVDAGRSGGTTYRYAVRAQAGCAMSAQSAEASAVATGACLLPPTFGGLASASTTGAIQCGNALSWSSATASCGGAITYDVYRSTDSGFVPAPANRIATTSGTHYTDVGDLVSGTRYWYVVRAVETAAAAVDDGNARAQGSAPSWAAVAFQDDFDLTRPGNPASYWAQQEAGATQLSLVAGCHSQVGPTAYKFGSPGVCGGAYQNYASSLLVLGGDGSAPMDGFPIPEGAQGTLSFHHWYQFETNFDGAVLRYSTAGPTGPFSTVPDSATPGSPYIVSGGYNSSAWGVERYWTGSSGGADGALPEVVVNIDALAGQTVWFAWSFFSDSSVTLEGLYLDDVRLETQNQCSTGPVQPGVASRLLVRGLPHTVGVGTDVSFSVEAVDQYGQVDTTFSGAATLSSSDAGATLPASVQLASGVAAGVVRFQHTGPQTVLAVETTHGWQATATALVTAGPPAGYVFPTLPTQVTAGSPFRVDVAVTDAQGNPVADGTSVSLALGDNPGGDQLQGVTTAQTSAGLASFSLALIRAGRGYTLVADGRATSAPFDVVGTYVSSLTIDGFPGTLLAGEPIDPPVTVRAVDIYGNPSGWQGTIRLTLTPPPDVEVGWTASAPTIDGTATFRDLVVSKVGTGYALSATADYLTSGWVIFDVVPGPARGVVIDQQPGGAVAGMPFTQPLRVHLVDGGGNAVSESGTEVTVGLAATSSARLLGDTTVTSAAGVAEFSNLAVDRAAQGLVLFVGNVGLQAETTDAFDVAPGPVASYAVSGAAAVAAGAGANYTVTPQDAQGALEVGYVGTALVTCSDPAAELPGTVSFTGHAPPVVQVVFHTTGPQTLTFTEQGNDAVHGAITVTVGDAVPAKGGGCSSAGGGDLAALLGLGLAVWLRPRRRGAR